MRGVAQSATALNLSIQRGSDALDRQRRRRDDQFIRQTKDSKTLPAQPYVPFLVLRPLLSALMARSVDFDNQPLFETNKVNDETSERNLSAKLRPLATPVPNGAPNDRLSLRRIGALLAGEAS